MVVLAEHGGDLVTNEVVSFLDSQVVDKLMQPSSNITENTLHARDRPYSKLLDALRRLREHVARDGDLADT